MAHTRLLAALIAAAALITTGCGSDDDGGDSTTTTTAEAPDSASAAFCGAWDNFENAQDGAQLNTALGTLGEELPEDAPDEVATALDTLGTGDVEPEETIDAANTVAAYVLDECGDQAGTPSDDPTAVEVSAALCAAWDDYQNAQDGAQLNTALGIITTELPAGAPDDVTAAIVVLGSGDVDPSDTVAASDTVGNWIDENC